MFTLAEHLGKTVSEIEQITVSEWNHWIAYLNIKQTRLTHDKQRSTTNIPRR